MRGRCVSATGGQACRIVIVNVCLALPHRFAQIMLLPALAKCHVEFGVREHVGLRLGFRVEGLWFRV